MSGVCLYKSKIKNKKLNLGSTFNSSNNFSLVIEGKAKIELKMLMTAFLVLEFQNLMKHHQLKKIMLVKLLINLEI